MRPSSLVFAVLLAVSCASAQTVRNPLIPQRADPWMIRHSDGFVYFTATVPEYDRLELRRASSVAALAEVAPTTVWRKHDSGPMGSHIWAPELHFIEGSWFLYFAAGDASRVWDIRIYVLENKSADPLTPTWIERGQLKTGWESFSLDATTFVHRGIRYLLWAQKDPQIKGNTNLYLSQMKDPMTLMGPVTRLSQPDHPWEKVRYWVNEGPAVLTRNGRIFVSFSAAGTGSEYCIGLLSASEDADFLQADAWTKTVTPVFALSEENSIFGPGHNCFIRSDDGTSDLLVYHARSYREIKGDPLRDPNRHTRIQTFTWNPDGTPNFGVPRPDTWNPQ